MKRPDTHYVVLDKCSYMPGSCKGLYRRLGVVEIEGHLKADDIRMLSTRAVGVRRIVRTWEKCHKGKRKGAYWDALDEATKLARRLNSVYNGTDEDDYSYETDACLPAGWRVAVWSDGRALVVPPQHEPVELGGRASSADSKYAALHALLVDQLNALL